MKNNKIIKSLKKLFQKNGFFRYPITFIITITLLFSFLFLTMLIPFDWVKDNTVSSMKKLSDVNVLVGKKVKEYEKKDIGETIIFDANYLIDEEKPLQSLVEMNYIGSGSFLNTELRDKIQKQEYSRYWVGMVAYSRILLIFTDIDGIRIINALILGVLTIILCRQLFKESKALALSFIISSIVVSSWVVTTSVQYMAVPLIALISSVVLVKMYKKKSKNIDLVFLVNGIATAFFDMLTIETLAITLPLFIFLYLYIKDNKKLLFKDFVKYVALWGFGYVFSFATKWVIDLIYYGVDYAKFIFDKASIRVVSEAYNFSNIFSLLVGMFTLLFPFGEFKFGFVIPLIILVFFIYNLVFYVDKKKYIYLILICLIPIVRYMALFSHSEILYGFTFRALFPIVMFVSLISIKQISNIFKRKKLS